MKASGYPGYGQWADRRRRLRLIEKRKPPAGAAAGGFVNAKNGADQSTMTITLDALTTAYTSLPTARPRFSADSMVIIETISAPPGSSMITSLFTAPGLIALIVPFRLLRALSFIVHLLVVRGRQTGP